MNNAARQYRPIALASTKGSPVHLSTDRRREQSIGGRSSTSQMQPLDFGSISPNGVDRATGLHTMPPPPPPPAAFDYDAEVRRLTGSVAEPVIAVPNPTVAHFNPGFVENRNAPRAGGPTQACRFRWKQNGEQPEEGHAAAPLLMDVNPRTKSKANFYRSELINVPASQAPRVTSATVAKVQAKQQLAQAVAPRGGGGAWQQMSPEQRAAAILSGRK
jgi:hypothetical protein